MARRLRLLTQLRLVVRHQHLGRNMKAAVLHAYDEKLTGKEFVKYEDVADPKINRPSDVIVRIGGAGVCRTDLHIVEGIWRSKVDVNLPYIMGHENAGWVEEVGKGVRGREDRRRGDLPPARHQRPLLGVSSRRRHARRGQQFSRHQRQRRLRAVPADRRAHADQIAEDARAERRRSLHRCGPYRLSRGQEGVAPPFAGGIRRRRSAPAASAISESRC